MTEITFSDISQWQPNIDAPAYLAGGHTILIVRAFSRDPYGPDTMMPERRDYLREFNFTAIGWYQRLHAERDPAQQARDFIDTIGPLRSNEFPVLDLEDGTGDQTARAESWFRVVDDWCGFLAALYSGEWFLNENLDGPGHWNRPVWIANYSEEPAGADWHQFSCTHHFPGLDGEVDGNRYRGTAQAFLALVRPLPGGPPPDDGDTALEPPVEGGPVVANVDGRLEVFAGEHVAHRWQTRAGGAWNESGWAQLGRPDNEGATMISVVANRDGRLECFVVTAENEVLHRWQATKGGGWNEGGWSSMGKPGGRPNDDTTISAILNHDGRVEVFADVAGEVFHRWQSKPGQGFAPEWSSMGTP